ncbi:WAS/WASL-interacting protein family member 3-like [Schistocerca nitens]|uniref:WAS/WASL-interacting protein family member 3-like n=1 Tax=Schistocerca nitens TaxID=7011 RepID=UPI00211799F8|nr:WAS/WASL-interacting protein family member 3-like [Schistocerca nitens]
MRWFEFLEFTILIVNKCTKRVVTCVGGGGSGSRSRASSRSPSPSPPLALPQPQAAQPRACACSRSSSGSRSSATSSLTSIPPPSPVRICRPASARLPTARKRVCFTPPPACGAARKAAPRPAYSAADASAWRPRITRPALATLGGPGGRPWDTVAARPDVTYRASSGSYVRPTWARRYYSLPPPPPPTFCNCPQCLMERSYNYCPY